MLAVLDSGAAVSIISKKLLDKIGLKINDEAVTIVVMAMGAKAKILEKVKGKVAEVLISNTGIKNLATLQEDGCDSEGSDTFNEFDYEEEEEIWEVEGCFLEEWPASYEENSVLYLTNIEEMLVQDNSNELKTLEEQILESINKHNLESIQQQQAQDLLMPEKDIFALGLEDLGQTNVIIHVIDTSDAASVKQGPYKIAYEEN
ncbi:5775_t:CDS:2, partial [Cetraspora pellucida]